MTTKTGRRALDASSPKQGAPGGSDVPGPAAIVVSQPEGETLLDPALALAADVLDDLERVRIANENRIRQLTRSGEDKDGEERGFGLDPDHPDVMRLGLIVFALEKIEHDAVLELQRKLRKHPLGPWMKAQKGIGEKQGARLLAAIGDPYINSAKGEPRTVSALWAYCGFHVLPAGQSSDDDQGSVARRDQFPDQALADAQVWIVGDGGDPGRDGIDTHCVIAGVAAKRRKGERANWSTKAKMRAYLIAESCMKTGKCQTCRDGHTVRDNQAGVAVPAADPQCRDSHRTLDDQTASAVAACACSLYRLAYDRRRAHTATTHPDWSDGHSHNDALRVTAKEILKDLWRAARDWHLQQATQDE